MESNFWRVLDDLVAGADICIDRPRGSVHPRYPDMTYSLDYGYLTGTTAADGSGIDVWVGSLPARKVTAVICTVDALKRDAEIKVLLGCTLEEAQTVLAMHDSGSQGAILVEREVVEREGL